MASKKLNSILSSLPLFLLMSLISQGGCLYRQGLKDPYFESFFEKTRIIMTEEELKIYKRLPDEKTKKEFIREFWQIRDPDPLTEENEGKMEFEERIEYANKWFGKFNPHRGVELYEAHERYRGWNSERGRIYIILGPPDELIYDGTNLIFGGRRRSQAGAQGLEQWYYYRYSLSVLFKKTRDGRWKLASAGAELIDTLERTKLNMVIPGFREDMDRRLICRAKFKTGSIVILIPTTRIRFKETGERLQAEFSVRINVYLNHRKINTLEKTFSREYTVDELAETKAAVLTVPFKPDHKGRYLLDIIVEDMLAMAFSKYRTLVHIRKRI
jgi:GWxTD domain-containing protein